MSIWVAVTTAAVACAGVMLWNAKDEGLRARTAAWLGGAHWDAGKPYAEVLDKWRRLHAGKALRMPVTLVVLVDTADPVAAPTYTVPAGVADRATWVMWVDEAGAFVREEWYFREVRPVQLLHGGVLEEHPNFFGHPKA